MNTLTCSRCGNELAEEVKFCNHCGERTECAGDMPSVDTGTCSNCRHPVVLGQRFCGNCGGDLTDRSDAPTLSPDSRRAEPTAVHPVKPMPSSPRDAHDGRSVDDEIDGVPLRSREASVPNYLGHLTIVSAADKGREIPLGPEMTVGKDPDAEIPLTDDDFASHRHAQISSDGHGSVIEDQGSRNGTFVEIRGKYGLRDGDRVLIGTSLFEYHTERAASGERRGRVARPGVYPSVR